MATASIGRTAALASPIRLRGCLAILRKNTGNAFASFLLGYASSGGLETPRDVRQIWNYVGGYVQDDWRIRPTSPSTSVYATNTLCRSTAARLSA